MFLCLGRKKLQHKIKFCVKVYTSVNSDLLQCHRASRRTAGETTGITYCSNEIARADFGLDFLILLIGREYDLSDWGETWAIFPLQTIVLLQLHNSIE